MWRDEAADPPLLVCQVGSTKLTYLLSVLDDLPAWLREQGDWVPLGAADEKKDAADGTVEAWGRSEDNPVGGWYGQRKGYRGRLGMYVPPLLEALGLAELTHEARNNSVRATDQGPGLTVTSGMVASRGRSSTWRMASATVSARIQSPASYSLPSCSCTFSCIGVAVRPG